VKHKFKVRIFEKHKASSSLFAVLHFSRITGRAGFFLTRRDASVMLAT
jgi:hypothetical protein